MKPLLGRVRVIIDRNEGRRGIRHREFREYDRIFSLGEGGGIERILRREREEHVTDVLKWKINSWEPFSVISVILYGLWTRVGVLQ